MEDKKDHFTNQFVHNLILHNNLKGGHFNKILNLHKGDIHNIYHKIKNLNNNNVDSHIPMTDHLETISEKTGGSAAVGGSMKIGGSASMGGHATPRNYDSGGSASMGGSLHTGGSFHKLLGAHGDLAKNFYHHVLKLPNRDWELYREGASQMLGAIPSPMWNHIKIALTGIHPRSNPEAYENVLRMPNTHAAARMIEAESGHQRNGPFVNAISDLHSKVKHAYSNFNLADEPLHPDEKLKTMQGGSFHDLIKPIAHTISGLKPGHDFQKILHATNNAIHDTVQGVMPDYLKTAIKSTADTISNYMDHKPDNNNNIKTGGRLDESIIKLIHDKDMDLNNQSLKEYSKHFDHNKDKHNQDIEGGRPLSISQNRIKIIKSIFLF